MQRLGYIVSYRHPDGVGANKAACLAVVTSGADAFAPRTTLFQTFADRVAMLALGHGASSWAELAEAFPEAEAERAALSSELKAEVAVTEITTVRL
jgi:hypothetical protein